ncbi:hypothetical protein LUZ63_001028 [Rhynchospora breviuscula]|uniref:SMP domain-containing protein n=1 Tax=Rhynchospora breviuscula TaxID=2022672 RepID=A0A9Q0HWK0_9POAL|nr:hypothetical protein LUZ63_001028 [Rhynchospora breviuscula]
MSKQPLVKSENTGDNVSSAEGDTVGSSVPGGYAASDTARSQDLLPGTFPELRVSDRGIEEDAVTIGEALEAAALVLGEKPIDLADAAAVCAAEMRATGLAGVVPGGVGAAALAAAESNMRNEKESEGKKTTMSDVLGNASAVLPVHKVVRREDAVSVRAAEEQCRRAGDGMETGYGVSAMVMEAVELNEDGIL